MQKKIHSVVKFKNSGSESSNTRKRRFHQNNSHGVYRSNSNGVTQKQIKWYVWPYELFI